MTGDEQIEDQDRFGPGAPTSALFMAFSRLPTESLKEPTSLQPSCWNMAPRQAMAALQHKHTLSSFRSFRTLRSSFSSFTTKALSSHAP